MGLSQFLSVDWFTACSDSEKTSPASTSTSSSSCKSTTFVCAIIVYRLREWWSSLVCCTMGLSTVPVCQHARSVPACQRVILEVSALPWMFSGGSNSPRCPEGQVVVPLCKMVQNSQDCTYGSDLFVMMISVCFSLSCDGLLAVFVTINCYSLSLFIV